MFDVSTGEILVIAFFILLLYGPDRIPEMARKIGKYTRDFKRTADEVRKTWNHEIQKLDQAEQQKTIAPPEPKKEDGDKPKPS